jgi:hypothetical protein
MCVAVHLRLPSGPVKRDLCSAASVFCRKWQLSHSGMVKAGSQGGPDIPDVAWGTGAPGVVSGSAMLLQRSMKRSRSGPPDSRWALQRFTSSSRARSGASRSRGRYVFSTAIQELFRLRAVWKRDARPAAKKSGRDHGVAGVRRAGRRLRNPWRRSGACLLKGPAATGCGSSLFPSAAAAAITGTPKQRRARPGLAGLAQARKAAPALDEDGPSLGSAWRP